MSRGPHWPITTLKIEPLMRDLGEHYMIVIITRNTRQAMHASVLTVQKYCIGGGPKIIIRLEGRASSPDFHQRLGVSSSNNGELISRFRLPFWPKIGTDNPGLRVPISEL